MVRYHLEVATVTDILIRNLPDELVAAIDARAKRVGLSRNEYLRRTLERERAGIAGPVTAVDLERLTSLAADLDDPDVMSGAWS
jgi:plasmid stability protein